MEAKVKDNARFNTYIFFSGHEFIKGDWRPVPVGSEEQARAEALLDVRNGKKQPVEKIEKLPPVILPAKDFEYIKEKSHKRGRKRKDEVGDDMEDA